MKKQKRKYTKRSPIRIETGIERPEMKTFISVNPAYERELDASLKKLNKTNCVTIDNSAIPHEWVRKHLNKLSVGKKRNYYFRRLLVAEGTQVHYFVPGIAIEKQAKKLRLDVSKLKVLGMRIWLND